MAGRTLGEDGSVEGLDGDGPRGPVSALAGRGDQRPAGRGIDPRLGAAGPPLPLRPRNPALRGWLRQLCYRILPDLSVSGAPRTRSPRQAPADPAGRVPPGTSD